MHQTIYSKLIYIDSLKPYTLKYPQLRSLLKLSIIQVIYLHFCKDKWGISLVAGETENVSLDILYQRNQNKMLQTNGL